MTPLPDFLVPLHQRLLDLHHRVHDLLDLGMDESRRDVDRLMAFVTLTRLNADRHLLLHDIDTEVSSRTPKATEPRELSISPLSPGEILDLLIIRHVRNDLDLTPVHVLSTLLQELLSYRQAFLTHHQAKTFLNSPRQYQRLTKPKDMADGT